MLKTYTLVDQVANHLREEITRGRWTTHLPGRDFLVKELGVNGGTVARAIAKLEMEGVLQAQGKGKRRRVVRDLPRSQPTTRVRMMLYEARDIYDPMIVGLSHKLESLGHQVTFTPKSLMELKHDTKRVIATLEKEPADAHVLLAAPRFVLEELATRSIPTFALFGRMSGIPIAGVGPDTIETMRDTIQSLVDNGHQRIVKLSRAESVQPELGRLEQIFLKELEMHGLPASSYNLPYWENDAEGLRHCLDQLFRITPPTAIIMDEWMLYYVLQNYLAGKRGDAYRDAICISMDHHTSFHWCQPPVPHFKWDPDAFVRATVRWVNAVARGAQSKKQLRVKTKFVDNGRLVPIDK